MATRIIEFWKANPDFWICHPSKQSEADECIRASFWEYDWSSENLIGQIIYLDQFSRHFCRYGLISESEVEKLRYLATQYVKDHLEELQKFDEIEIIFALMPFKHLSKFDFIFEYLHSTWLQGRKIIDMPKLQRFYIDTYKKAFISDRIACDIITTHKLEPYDASLICDYYPKIYNEEWSMPSHIENDTFIKCLSKIKKCIVSLSGGVDSMVMLSVLKNVIRADVRAVHIVYGNRTESEYEYRFLAKFCHKLCVPLAVYRIKWLRRGEIDREFYENMTREIRFAVYKAVEIKPRVLLGHICDDIVENIWTNIAHCHHLGDLKKMAVEEIQHDVSIMRPLLSCNKEDIYKISADCGIPYLKNTTPSWSNRGKFREHFHNATVLQFGKSIDTKILAFADAMSEQTHMLDALLYKPIYNSFKNNVLNITPAIKAELGIAGWQLIFEEICHKRLEINRPSMKAISDFCNRLKKLSQPLKVEMSKNLVVMVTYTTDEKYLMTFTIKN